jgi:hypothetical protein
MHLAGYHHHVWTGLSCFLFSKKVFVNLTISLPNCRLPRVTGEVLDRLSVDRVAALVNEPSFALVVATVAVADIGLDVRVCKKMSGVKFLFGKGRNTLAFVAAT